MPLTRPIVMQIGAILALGGAIGVADAFLLRPVQFGRQAPPPIDLTSPAAPKPEPAPAAPDSPGVTAQPTQPLPAAPVAQNAEPSALEPAFTPSAKDKIPSGHITLDEAKAIFDAGGSFVDTRRKEEYETSRVPGALRIPLADFSKGDPQALMLIPREANVVVYCNGGACDESEKVAQMLNNSGYAKVYVLHDGMPGWAKFGYPTESGPGLLP